MFYNIVPIIFGTTTLKENHIHQFKSTLLNDSHSSKSSNKITNICYLYSFVDGHSDRSKVMAHCGFYVLISQEVYLCIVHYYYSNVAFCHTVLKLLYSSYHNICYFPKWRKTLDKVGDSNLTINGHPSPISVSNHRAKHNVSSTPYLT